MAAINILAFDKCPLCGEALRRFSAAHRMWHCASCDRSFDEREMRIYHEPTPREIDDFLREHPVFDRSLITYKDVPLSQACWDRYYRWRDAKRLAEADDHELVPVTIRSGRCVHPYQPPGRPYWQLRLLVKLRRWSIDFLESWGFVFRRRRWRGSRRF